MLGDEEHPISFLFEYEKRGDHVHVQVRAGARPHRAAVGRLVFREAEWALLRELLLRNRPMLREKLDLTAELGGWLDANAIELLPVTGMVDS